MRLLLVEDDDMIAETVLGAMRRSGYAIDWAEDGRAAEALNEYEVALKRDPRRFRSFSGAAQAAAAAGNSDKAHQYYGLLVEMAGAGDARPQVVAARQYLAR